MIQDGVDRSLSEQQGFNRKSKQNDVGIILSSSNRTQNVIVEDSQSPIIGGISRERIKLTDSDGFTTMQHAMRHAKNIQTPQTSSLAQPMPNGFEHL